MDYHDYALIDAGYNYSSGTSDFMIAYRNGEELDEETLALPQIMKVIDHYETYGEDDKTAALAALGA